MKYLLLFVLKNYQNKRFQVSNAMPRPQLTLCPHTHMDIIKAGELLHYYGNEIQDSRPHDIFPNTETKHIMETSVGVIKSLSNLYKELDKVPDTEHKNITNKLQIWKNVKEDLLSASVFIALAKNKWYFEKSYPDYVALLMILCQKENININCTNKHIHTVSFAMIFNFQSCFYFDMLLGGVLDEATSEGIGNGLTVVMMAENTILHALFNLSSNEPIPGMRNFMSPSISRSSAMKGVQFIVNENGVVPLSPYTHCLDIPPGVSAIVGLTAKRIHHLQHPYTNCSLVNPELPTC